MLPISTHALREEGDGTLRYDKPYVLLFLPTPSARRATFNTAKGTTYTSQISTHALREEGDVYKLDETVATPVFLPTPSARRATRLTLRRPRLCGISTHALREEGDPW